MNPAISPVTERLPTIDALRGVAVLGILLMNVAGFAFHPAAYNDPTIQGGASGVNYWTFLVNAVLVDGAMRGIFTILFGAGVCLLTGRAESRGAAAVAADIYYRRILWLLVFGVLHAYLLWWGEVLYPYALLGLVLYPFRRMSVRGLIAGAALLAVLMTGLAIYDARKAERQRAAWTSVQELRQAGKVLTDEDNSAASGWETKLKLMKPDARAVAANRAANTGSLISMIRVRAEAVGFYHHQALYSPMQWDYLALMLLGMALLKTGVLTAERPDRFYGGMALAGYALGLPLHAAQLYTQTSGWFSITATLWASSYYEFARIAICLGHIAVCMLLFRHAVARGLTRALAAAGQMALTNYLMQSVVCTLVFNGMGLYGRLERHQAYYVVFAIWAAQLWWSPFWLRRFRFGPAEWVWRSLSYWQRQPMQRGRAPGGSAAESMATVVN